MMLGFGFGKKKNEKIKNGKEAEDNLAEPEKTAKKGWFSRLTNGLQKTSDQLSESVATAVLGKKTIDDELLEELETTLLIADVGVSATQQIIENITQQVKRKELDDPEKLVFTLKQELINILTPCNQPLEINQAPFVILMVGVNGAGKTTSIAKLTHFFQQQGKRVMLAAGDTFRAAAIEQLQHWGEKNSVPVIAQKAGSDSASVIYDAMQAAKARNYDILIADTAGRLHTQDHLMAELSKIKRVIQKFDVNAPHETMLILDASMGQNALNQAKQFHEAVDISSISLTKLDGTAKGGIIFSIAQQMNLPIRFIGIGEKMDDLKPFKADEFVEALFSNNGK